LIFILFYFNFKYNNIRIIYMSRPFTNTSSANRAFGQFNEPKDASDYLYNKKARSTYSVANSCHPSIKVYSESDRLLFNKSNKLSLYPCRGTVNPANLNINLITRLNLSNVAIIKDLSNNQIPSTIDDNAIPFLRYEIDPNGSLFGDSTCGIYNFKRYLRPEITLPSYIIIDGNYLLSSDASYNTIITFTTNSIMRVLKDLSMNYIVVGGGGGAGHAYPVNYGGGGGGQVKQGNFTTGFNETYNIKIGAGGAGGGGPSPYTGQNGESSSISSTSISITSLGGIGSTSNKNGGNSGAGGAGGTYYNGFPPAPSTINGTNGGGGAGGSGQQALAGNGGLSSVNSLYGGGGGGGSGNGFIAGGLGVGGGGNGGDVSSSGQNGKPNTGGGGGAAGAVVQTATGGNGGSGVVVLAFNA